MTLPLLVSETHGVVRLTLNRPKTKNALNPELVSMLGDALERAASTPTNRVIVLSGAGGSFCSGADLMEDFQPHRTELPLLEARLDAFQRLIRCITSAPQVVIAEVDGPAVGFGADLALACDLRIVSEKAYFQEKFIAIGLMPDGGASYFLPRLVGVGRALELLLTGRAVQAAEALALGLASEVVPADSLEACVDGWAERFQGAAPLAVQRIKQAVRSSLHGDLAEGLAREKEGQLRLLKSADLLEGVTAFREKRTPSFRGS
ncbi:MAG: enoyl-CoA hydratase-related protein [Polyangiaceae bacterium]|nr:enoyl-CoA hydratase-related protein [Polyangiaceae bacterium]